MRIAFCICEKQYAGLVARFYIPCSEITLTVLTIIILYHCTLIHKGKDIAKIVAENVGVVANEWKVTRIMQNFFR